MNGSRQTEPRVFKISAGQRNRDLSQIFLSNDFAAIGPGAYGDWRHFTDRASVSRRDRTPLNLMEDLIDGDLAVLTIGQEIVSVGQVAETYSFNSEWKGFGQWDLLNSVRIKWAQPHQSEVMDAFRKADGGHPRPKVTPRTRLCWLRSGSDAAKAWARDVHHELAEIDYWQRDLQPRTLPFDDPETELSALSSFSGLPKQTRRAIQDVFERAAAVRMGMDGHGSHSEHGAVALLVAPFLEALGWGPELLAFEWHWVDVAGFSTADATEPTFLVEAKRPGTGLDWALGQARRYSKTNRLECPVLTTDGFYWALFENAHEREPCADLLLPSPRRGSDEFFLKLKQLGLVRESAA